MKMGKEDKRTKTKESVTKTSFNVFGLKDCADLHRKPDKMDYRNSAAISALQYNFKVFFSLSSNLCHGFALPNFIFV